MIPTGFQTVWQEIETIAIEEDGIVNVARTEAPDGTPYALWGARIIVGLPAGESDQKCNRGHLLSLVCDKPISNLYAERKRHRTRNTNSPVERGA